MNILHNSVNIERARKENFPVASLLIPKHLRTAIHVLYQFARSMDDIADNQALTTSDRKKFIQHYEEELDKIATKIPSESPLFQALSRVVEQHQLPMTPLYHLLQTLRQDIDFKQPNSFTELLTYCEGSANTIGEIFLHLFKANVPSLKQQSDGICTALQLIDFWQDMIDDYQEGRIYLPTEDMAHFHLTEQQLSLKQFTPEWQQCMQLQLQRTHQLLLQGASLPLHLSGRLGWEIRIMVIAGLMLLHKMEKMHGNTFEQVPKLSAVNWLHVLWKTLRYKHLIEQEKNITIDCS